MLLGQTKSMKGLSVLFTVALFVIAHQLAARLKASKELQAPAQSAGAPVSVSTPPVAAFEMGATGKLVNYTPPSKHRP
jgi:hypothetical protein